MEKLLANKLTHFLFLFFLFYLNVNNLLNAQDSIYLSNTGNDLNSGSIRYPLKTLSKAIIVSRKNNVKHIYIRGGKYYGVSVILTSKDSGLYISNYKGEKVVLSGSVLSDSLYKSGKFIVQKLQGTRNRSWDFRMLLVNGSPRMLAHISDTLSFKNIWNIKAKPATEGFWEKKPSVEALSNLLYSGFDLNDIDINNAEVMIPHRWDETYSAFVNLDTVKKVAVLAYPALQPLGSYGADSLSRGKYLIWNVKQGMLGPGNWYLDRLNEKLYYWPYPNEKLDNLILEIPRYRAIFNFQAGCSNIIIQGLDIKGCTNVLQNELFAGYGIDATVMGDSINNIVIKNCSINNSGGSGINLKGSNIHIVNSNFFDLHGGGIYLKGNYNTVDHCKIENVGNFFRSSVAIAASGKKNRFINNYISNVPYSGICGIGDSSLIDNNIIYNAMQVLSDGAFIYEGLHSMVKIQNNLLVDTDSSKVKKFRLGIYFDEKSLSCYVNNNITFNIGVPVHCHLARNIHYFQNNFLSDNEQRLSFRNSEEIFFNKNLFIIKGKLRPYIYPENSFSMIINNFIDNTIFYSSKDLVDNFLIKLSNNNSISQQDATILDSKIRKIVYINKN
ncbi:right-handed parallel beta-helix repeat-containing protein [Siphonobacter curvatus]|nr:right-handed parallel beta-helix repeat-containing protein [Siphonobacter curvatus]